MSFMDFLLGEKGKTKEFQRYNEQQQNVLNDILSRSSGQLGGGFDFLEGILGQSPEAMQQFQAPALRAFQEETLPSIAERFTGALGEGSQRSSAFGQQLGQAGAGLQENLAAQRGQLSFNALQQLMNLLGTGLTQQTDKAYFNRQPGFLENLGAGLGAGFGKGAGAAFGGGLGGLFI